MCLICCRAPATRSSPARCVVSADDGNDAHRETRRDARREQRDAAEVPITSSSTGGGGKQGPYVDGIARKSDTPVQPTATPTGDNLGTTGSEAGAGRAEAARPVDMAAAALADAQRISRA